jgi:hypothetical protein
MAEFGVRRRYNHCDKESRTMKYLMLICVDESKQPTPEESRQHRSDTDVWVKEMDGRGVRLQGNALKPVRTGKTVRVRDGEVLIADGPFAETKEQIAGFDILECADLDEAVEVASKHPMAGFGAVEVRAFYEP